MKAGQLNHMLGHLDLGAIHLFVEGGQRQSSVIGSRLIVDGQPLEIIGVTAAGFSGPEVGPRFDLALPLCSLSVLHLGDQPPFARRDYYWLNVMGRLKPGWTIARATEQLQSISPSILQATVPSGYSRGSLKRYMGFRLAAFPGEDRDVFQAA